MAFWSSLTREGRRKQRSTLRAFLLPEARITVRSIIGRTGITWEQFHQVEDNLCPNGLMNYLRKTKSNSAMSHGSMSTLGCTTTSVRRQPTSPMWKNGHCPGFCLGFGPCAMPTETSTIQACFVSTVEERLSKS